MDADGADFFAFEDITWQTTPPPVRHPVPAEHVRDLDVGDELSIGVPDRYLIDGQILLRTDRQTMALPGQSTLHEALAVCAPIHYWTWQVYPERIPVMQWWPIEYAWVYRDAVRPEGGSAPRGPERWPVDGHGSWLERVRPDATQPPVLLPVPAREAGSLMGRTLRSRNAAGEWFWFIGVSEPVEVEGDICVHVVPQSHWWLHQVGYHPELQEKVRVIPLHRLFAYD